MKRLHRVLVLASALVLSVVASADKRAIIYDPDPTHTGVVQGTVKDNAGSAVKGATVILTDTVTRERSTQTSDQEGNYRFMKLFPGLYDLRAEKDSRNDSAQVKIQNDKTETQDFRIK